MAAPQPGKSDQASKVTSPPASGAPANPGKSATPAGSPPRPARRAGSFLSRLLLSILILFIVLGVAGYGALMLRDTDPRVGVAARYVDQGLGEAQGLIAQFTGEKTTPALDKTPAPPAAPEPTPTPETSAEAPAAPKPAVTPEPAPAPEKPAQPKSAEAWTPPKPAEPAPAQAVAEPKPIEPKPIESKPVQSTPVEPKPIEPRPAEPRPTDSAAAERVPAPAAKAESRDADGFTDRDLIYGLEGRIDAVGDEIRALREKLDAPKSEARAETDAEVQKPAATPDASAAAVVLAFAIQRELETGRPFAAEVAAFSRLAAEPAPAPALVEFAEKGAPTGAALREEFLPVARKLRAHENRADSGALTDHLLQGASKLVKVRPAGEAQPETLDGKLARLEAALGHNDFGAAAALFDTLPEEARAEAGDFGARLRQRHEAAQAADALLSGAIAALGKK